MRRQSATLSHLLSSVAASSSGEVHGRSLSSHVAAIATPLRCQTRVPNKGYREQPAIPDRLKDAMSFLGTDMRNVKADDADPPYIPEERRQKMLQEVMSSTQNMKNMSKMDRLRTSLDAVRNQSSEDEGWKEVYMFLRTTEFCCEVMASPADAVPKGQKLWIEMQLCEEKRTPVLMEMPNGMLVLPIFSMEEYLDFFFSRVHAYESCWFPIPRHGSQWEEFCKLPFPTCVTGELQHFSMLATIALGSQQFGICINPGQRSSKFLTYPEMVTLAQQKRQRSKDRNLSLKRIGADGFTEEDLFDRHLLTIFDTRKMPMRRVEPSEIAAKVAKRPPIPPISQLELHLLLHKYDEILAVYIRSVDRPKWRTLLGASEKMTQVDIVSCPDRKPPPDFFAHLQRWSFMKELNSDVHVELTATAPQSDGTNAFMCVYTQEDGRFLRSMETFKSQTLADQLSFNAPLTDAEGHRPYEMYTSYW